MKGLHILEPLGFTCKRFWCLLWSDKKCKGHWYFDGLMVDDSYHVTCACNVWNLRCRVLVIAMLLHATPYPRYPPPPCPLFGTAATQGGGHTVSAQTVGIGWGLAGRVEGT